MPHLNEIADGKPRARIFRAVHERRIGCCRDRLDRSAGGISPDQSLSPGTARVVEADDVSLAC